MRHIRKKDRRRYMRLTMAEVNLPAVNPSDVRTQAGILEFTQKKFKSTIEKVIPAQVISYDRATNRAEVQILPLDITSTGEKLQRRPLLNIPILTLTGGGFVFSLPVKAGDVGWIVASDKDISVFKQTLAEYTPNTYRRHKYEDSFFIPDNLNGFTIAEDDNEAVLLSSVDGVTKISLKDGVATITAASVIVNGETTINGNTTINGDLNISGTATATTEVVGGGISLTGHVHGGVTGGSGTTGTPQ